MKILLIAYSFPPFQDGQSLRWYYLSNALAELGVQIDVITIKHPLEDKITWNFHKNIEIFRIYPGPIEFFALRAKKNMGVGDGGNKELRKSLKFKMMKSSYWGIRNFVGNLLPGDIRTEWFPFTIRFIKENIDIRKYDYLITSHEPWVDSLLGLYLKKRDAKIKWIADFGDPYIAPYTSKHKLWFENYFEKLIYKNASVLIFTNGKVIEHLSNKYPFLKNKKLLVIEQGFSYRLSAEINDVQYKNKIFTLIYTGTFYRNFRDPSNLIKALSMIDFEYKFCLAGRNEKFIKDFSILGDNFEFLGVVDHFNILKLQKASDVLIHLANKNTSIQIPGKFYEYLGALKPILSIHFDCEDPTRKLVKELRCGISCEDNPIEIKNAIESIYKNWKRNENNCKASLEGICDFSWEKKAKIIYKNLKATVAV
ncbi:MAG: hypothetical protein QMC83_02770 [Thermodesulfovibrionales bacterium]|nr:hypothetical protein [Thermodesulfovibrionales bacterium]